MNNEGTCVIVDNNVEECVESVEHVYLIDGQNIQRLLPSQQGEEKEADEIIQEPTKLIFTNPNQVAKDFSCDICNFSTHAKANLRKHIKFKHSGLRFSCNECAYSSPQRGDVKRHHQAKHSDIKYACDVCEYIANSNSLLKEHKRMKHSGKIELYICEICNFSSAYRSALNKHIKLHSNAVFDCPECDFQTKRKDALDLHVKAIHRKQRIKCLECDFDCANRSALNNHLKSKHQEMRYECDICENTFTRKGTLTKHMENSHSELTVKKELSPYLIFYKEKYKELSYKHPYFTASEKKHFIRQLWKKLSLQEKERYKPRLYQQLSEPLSTKKCNDKEVLILRESCKKQPNILAPKPTFKSNQIKQNLETINVHQSKEILNPQITTDQKIMPQIPQQSIEFEPDQKQQFVQAMSSSLQSSQAMSSSLQSTQAVLSSHQSTQEMLSSQLSTQAMLSSHLPTQAMSTQQPTQLMSSVKKHSDQLNLPFKSNNKQDKLLLAHSKNYDLSEEHILNSVLPNVNNQNIDQIDVICDEVDENIEDQTYILLQTETGEIVQIIGDSNVLAEHFDTTNSTLINPIHQTNCLNEPRAGIGQIRLEQDETRPLINDNSKSVDIQPLIPVGSQKNDNKPTKVVENRSLVSKSRKEKVGKITQLYSCDVCDYVARLPHHLRSHKTSKHSDDWQMCPHCDYKAKRKDILRRHIRSEHDNVRYECEDCHYVTADSSSLKKHQESMHQGKLQSCRFCEEVFKHKSTRMKHINQKHKGLKQTIQKSVVDSNLTLPDHDTKQKKKSVKVRKSKQKEKLKRPPTKYILFCENEQKKVLADNPKISLPELGKELSRRWKILDSESKEEYDKKYQILLSQYNNKKIQLNESKKKLDSVQRLGSGAGLGVDDLRPLSAFFFFMKQERLEVRSCKPGITAREEVTIIRDRWRALTLEEKEYYRKESRLISRKQKIEAANIQRKEQGQEEIQIVSIELLDQYLQNASVEDLTNLGIKLNTLGDPDSQLVIPTSGH